MANEFISREECQFTHKQMAEKIREIDEKIDKISIDIAGLPGKLIEKLDLRYADKRTEKTVDKLIWMVISAVVLALLALVLKQ